VILSCVAVLLALAAPSGGAAERRPLQGWKLLRFEARSMPLLTGSFELKRDAQRLETRGTARLLGAPLARSRTTSLLDASTGCSRGFLSLSRSRGRRYTFDSDDYKVERFTSRGGPDAPAEKWEITSTESFPYPDAPLYDYYGMLVRLAHEPLRQAGDEVQLYVATAHGPRAYVVRVGDSRDGERSLADIETGAKKKHKLRELRLRIRPVDASAEEGFMNMEGETEIWVDAESKAPVEINGKVPKVGRVKLELVAFS
jgi:hypothetical protein